MPVCSPYDRLVRFVRSHGRLELLFLAVWILPFVREGATKGILQQGGASMALTAPRPALSAASAPVASASSGPGAGFRFSAIERSRDEVALSVIWNAGDFGTPPFIEFFARTNLVKGAWQLVGWTEAEAGETNLSVVVEADRMPGGMDGVLPIAFFSATATDGIGDDADDDDGDGLSNVAERILGTNPRRSDTDGDGYPDDDELAYASSGSVLPNFSTDSLTDLTGGTLPYAASPVAYDVALPFAVEIAGHVSTRAIVCSNGYALFPDGNSSLTAQSIDFTSSSLYAGPDSIVAAYGYMFMMLGYADSHLRAGTVYDATGRWFVVEWANMVDPLAYSFLMLGGATFQLAISEADPGTIHVRYVSLPPWLDGTDALIGAHGHGGSPGLLVANGVLGGVASGLVISYHFGTGTDPLNPDSDGDGLRDGWEAAYGTDPRVANDASAAPRFAPDADPDLDGLTNLRESALGTNPFQPDTDGDGMDDGWEAAHGFDAATHNGATARMDDDAAADPDGDGLTNSQECEWGADPGMPDTDGDGVNDGVEAAQNGDPADAEDGGRPNSRVVATISLGDHSTSQSEKYTVVFTPIVGSGQGGTPATIRRISQRYDGCAPISVPLKPGWRYEVRLDHAGSDPAYTGTPKPDYDYTLEFSPQPANVLLDDPQELFGVHGWESGAFLAADKAATVTVYKVDLEICTPNDESWTELDVSRVVLDDEELRIKVTILPQMDDLAACRFQFGDSIQIKTSGTCPQGAAVSLDGATFANVGGRSEIRVAKTFAQLRELGLLPTQDEDGVDEMAWLDMASGPGQSLADSEAFSGLGYADRGTSCSDASKTLTSAPPNSIPSESYFKAAGREIVTASFGGTMSAERQIMNQADVFYFSGHGDLRTGSLQGGFSSASICSYWKRDIQCAILAGCSVLNIGKFRNQSFGWTTSIYWNWRTRGKVVSPGAAWADNFNGVLLGFCWRAPLDEAGGNSLAARFSSAIRQGDDWITAWRNATDATYGYNACAIDCTVTPNRYWYWHEHNGNHVWTNVLKGATSAW